MTFITFQNKFSGHSKKKKKETLLQATVTHEYVPKNVNGFIRKMSNCYLQQVGECE